MLSLPGISWALIPMLAGERQSMRGGFPLSEEERPDMDPVQTLTPETFDQPDLLPAPQPLIPWQSQAHTSAYQARRFLKFLLPSIPVLAFSIDFLTAYILQARADLADHQ